MKNYERRVVVFGIALSLMTVVILVLSTCSIPFENIEEKQKPDASAIPVPQNVNAQTITASRIDLAWQDTPIAVSYSVYRSTAENGEYTEIATVQGTSYIDNSVSANTAYFYYLTLFANNMGESGKSATVQADTKPPMPPASITTAIISATKIIVTWQPVAAAESYKVYRSSAQDSGYAAITPLPITATSYSDETVSLNNDYYYRVTSINYLGEGGKSVYAKGSVKGPDAPQGLTAVPVSESSIKLEWGAVDGVTGYKVYKSTTGSGGAYTEQASVTETAWTDTGLIANTSYYYKVEAINGIGVTMSDFVEGKIIPPPAPLNVSASVESDTSIKLEWMAVDGVTGYKVYKSITGPGDTYTEQAT
jgi:fibronectin type 3 domain-containing protein